MADNTVFDSVFKTIVHKTPKLVIPLINEVFGRDYPRDEPIVQLSNEHEGPAGTRITDSVFEVRGRIYHVECQSTPDADMVVRMIEYDFAIALEGALNAGAPYEMDLPQSCVLFLRHTAKTPDELKMRVSLPDGGSFDYTVPVMKAQRFGSDEIFEKRLLLLLPYYLMRYEEALGDIAGDDDKTVRLIAECAELRADLESATLAEGDSLLYEQLVELIIRVTDHMLAAHEALRRKVRKAMGGEVLELMRDRAERLEREAEARGIERGIELGIEQGIKQGIEQGIEQGVEKGVEQGIEQGIAQGVKALSEKLKAAGVSDIVIAGAVADMQLETGAEE